LLFFGARPSPITFGLQFVSYTASVPKRKPADPVEVLIARCQARAHLVKTGDLDLIEAVDGLQDAAERAGLVASIGQDAVQQLMAGAFQSTMPVQAPPRPTNEPYRLVSRDGVASAAELQRTYDSTTARLRSGVGTACRRRPLMLCILSPGKRTRRVFGTSWPDELRTSAS
jgi:hypothetical protein